MAAVITYQNSKLASFFSIVGYLCIACGVYALFSDEALIGIISIVLGFGFKFLAAYTSKRKRMKDAKRSQNSK